MEEEKKSAQHFQRYERLKLCRLGDGVTLQRHRFGTQFEVFQVSLGVSSLLLFFSVPVEKGQRLYIITLVSIVCVWRVV